MAVRAEVRVNRSGGRGARAYAGRRLFGIPVGDFSLFQTVLLSLSIGFLSFFLVTFFSIFGVMIFDAATHRELTNLSISYKFIAFPVGVVMLLLSAGFLGSVWVRRRLSGEAR